MFGDKEGKTNQDREDHGYKKKSKSKGSDDRDKARDAVRGERRPSRDGTRRRVTRERAREGVETTARMINRQMTRDGRLAGHT